LAELKMISDYLGGQAGELKVVPQSKFRWDRWVKASTAFQGY
jgi:hypothetical protein